MSKKHRRKKQSRPRHPKKDLHIPKSFEEYNRIDPMNRAKMLATMGMEVHNKELLGLLTKSHFVIPGKTRYQCVQCGECCRYARKVATFTYEPCIYLNDDNTCEKHDSRYLVCKWFPFFVHLDPKFGHLLTIKPYCSGYDKGDLVDYDKIVNYLLSLKRTHANEPDGAEVIHEVIYVPAKRKWVFPSAKNIDELMIAVREEHSKQIEGQSRNIPRQLAQAQRYTSGLLSDIKDPNVTVNEQGIITDANEAAESLFDTPLDGLKGRPFKDLFSNEKTISGTLTIGFTRGKFISVPMSIKSNDGALIPVLCDGMTYRDHIDGMVHGILIAIHAVSKRVHDELKEARNYARALIESSIDAFVTCDEEGIITDVNEAATRITGAPRDSLIGEKFSRFFSEPERAEAGIRKCFEEGLVINYELDLLQKTGGVIPVSFNASVYRDTEGIVHGIFAAARDISETRKMLKEVESARSYARGLLESSLDSLVTFDRQGTIMDVNEAMIRCAGMSREELVGSKFSSLFKDPKKAQEFIDRSFEEGRLTNYENEMRTANAQILPVSFSATVYRDSEGAIQGVFAAARVLQDRPAR